MEHDQEIQKARDEKLVHQAQRQDLLKAAMEHQLTAIRMYLTIFTLHNLLRTLRIVAETSLIICHVF
jgi:hypothetical protein